MNKKNSITQLILIVSALSTAFINSTFAQTTAPSDQELAEKFKVLELSGARLPPKFRDNVRSCKSKVAADLKHYFEMEVNDQSLQESKVIRIKAGDTVTVSAKKDDKDPTLVIAHIEAKVTDANGKIQIHTGDIIIQRNLNAQDAAQYGSADLLAGPDIIFVYEECFKPSKSSKKKAETASANTADCTDDVARTIDQDLEADLLEPIVIPTSLK